MTAVSVRGHLLGGGTSVIVPLTAVDQATLRAQVEACAAADGIDLLEWRVDPLLAASLPVGDLTADATAFEHLVHDHLADPARELRRRIGETPLLLTLRTADEGGQLQIDADRYVSALRALLSLGIADVLDIQALAPAPDIAEALTAARVAGVPVIASHHRFDETPVPEEMARLLRELAASGADAVKLAVMPRRPQDVLDLLVVTQCLVEELDVPVITMSMGGLGALSRLAGPVTGSAATFAALGEASAPGQLPLELVVDWHRRRADPR